MTQNTKTPIFFKLISILIPCLLLGSQLGITAFGAEKLTISLVGIEAGFPEIRANVRIVGGDNRVPQSIDPEDVEIYENGIRIQDFEIVPAQSSSQLIAVYVDSGINTSYARDFGASQIREGLFAITDATYFDIEKDQILLNERKNTNGEDQTIQHMTADDPFTDLALRLSDISFAPGSQTTEPFIGLDETINQISDILDGDISKPSSLIFLYHNVNWPPTTQQVRLARAMSDKARAQGTRIYVIHANPTKEFSEPFEEMAANSGGIYINLAATDQPIERFVEIFDDLEPQTQTFAIRFNSNIIEPGTREIAIVPAGVPIRESTAVGTVDVSPNPVSIIVETSNTVNRVASGNDGALTFSPETSPVLAQVGSWPYILSDGDLTQAELFVNGVLVSQIENPDPDNMIFDLDLSKIESNQNLLIQVRLTDKTGLTFKSESSQVQVTVERPVATVIPAVVEQVSPQPTVVSPTATPFVVVSPPAPEPVDYLQLLPWLLSALMLLLLIGFSIFFIRRLNALEAGVARQAYKSGGILNLTRTIITGPVRGSVALARLEILDGPADLIGRNIEIFTHNVNIGRDPRRCDILLYDGDENSSVSGLHCVIQFDEGEFKITDGSSNGTRLNDEFLQTDLPATLSEGDEIILGDLFKRGAKLKFQLAPESAEAKSVVEKKKTSLAKLNLVDQDADEELIEAAEQPQEVDPPKSNKSRNRKRKAVDKNIKANKADVDSAEEAANDESWMDSLE